MDQPDRFTHPYAGRWIARIGSQILAHGYSPVQVRAVARQLRPKEIPIIAYIPQVKIMAFPASLYELQANLTDRQDVYLVGGAVRDALLNQPVNDLDFVCEKDTKKIAKLAADHFQGAFYCMDEVRETFRVILPGDMNSLKMDFMAMRGKSLEEDLLDRDFTINAMAVNLQDPQKLIDPLLGAQALREKRLTACSPKSFITDPVRILRGIRFAAEGQYQIEKSTREWMKSAVEGLRHTSIERKREELFRMLDHPKAATSLRALDWLGCFPYLLPELITAREREGKAWWDALLSQIDHWYTLLKFTEEQYSAEGAQEALIGLAVLKLGIFRSHIHTHFSMPVEPKRGRKGFAILAILINAVAESLGRDLLPMEVARQYHLSRTEIQWIQDFVRATKAITLLLEQQHPPAAVQVFQYFQQAPRSGIDAVVSALAREFGVAREQPTFQRWERMLDVCRILLDTYWNHPEVIQPPILLTGDQLIEAYQLDSGPEIGELLAMLREEQAAGNVKNLAEAHQWLQEKLNLQKK